MEKIELADGTVIESAHCLESAGALFVYLTGDDMTMTQGFALFSDPEKTKTIKEDRYGEKKTYRGYKTLAAISNEYGNVNIVLHKN